MFKIIFWSFMIIGLLFTFDIPQKIYYAIKKRGNEIEEVENGRTCYYDRNDIDNNWRTEWDWNNNDNCRAYGFIGYWCWPA